jgi:hypothetical protein
MPGWMPELVLKQSFTLERFPTSSPRIIWKPAFTSNSALEKPINCAGSLDITVNTE